jgi:capsular polysaccharide biosynthesis protein
MTNESFNLVELLKLLIKWKKHITTLTVLGAILGVVLAFVLPVYYKSTSQFYVYNQRTSDPVALMNMYKSEVMPSMLGDQFGNKDDASRIISIAYSDEIINFLIKKYDLSNHYKYDTTDSKSLEDFKDELKSNYSLFKNDDGSITVSVLDIDKQIAANIANDIVDYVEKKYFAILRSNRTKILEVFEERIQNKTLEYAQITDSINYLMQKYGIFDAKRDYEQLTNDFYKIELSYIDYKARVMELEKHLAPNDTLLLKTKSIAKGLEGQYLKITGTNSGLFASIKDLKEIQFKAKNLQNRYDIASLELVKLINLYNYNKDEFESKLPTIYILNKAKPANVKAKPIRWVVAALTTITAFIFGVIIVLMIEFYQRNVKELFESAS